MHRRCGTQRHDRVHPAQPCPGRRGDARGRVDRLLDAVSRTRCSVQRCTADAGHSDLIAYILRSLAQAVVVMLAVALIAFSMFRFVGDPVANMVGQEASLKERAELTERLGLNDPVPIQFGRFVFDMARGEFGMSYRQGRPVRDLLMERAPATVELALLSSLFSLAFGIALGV